MDAERIKEIQKLLGKYFETTTPNSTEGIPIFLPEGTCPQGMAPCDPRMGACPEEEHVGTQPLYTSEGLRCYTKVGIYKARLTTQDKSVIVNGVRDLVNQLDMLRNVNSQLDAEIEKNAVKIIPPTYYDF